MMTEEQWLNAAFWGAVPTPATEPAWQWAERHFKAVGSPVSEDWLLEFTPWFRDPLEWLDVRSVHSITFVGPAQETGKSAFGEIAVCYCIATRPGGDVQMNWQNDHLSKARFKKRVRRVLLACAPVAQLWPVGKFRNDATNGLVAFPHLNFIMQGVEGKGRLESDTIWVQVNEEVHEWEPETLGKADQRLKKVSFPKQINLSTGGVVDDQLHVKFKAGTRQEWQEQCPGCREWFTPGVKIFEDRPGGLKYDKARGKRKDGSYDYEGIAATAYVECPHCAHQMRDDPVERRRRALAGQLSAPLNPDPDLKHRSVRLSATACYSRPLVDIIRHKHDALRALKWGDIMPWKVYIQREEADFWNPQDRPMSGKVTVQDGLLKSKDGLIPHAIAAGVKVEAGVGTLTHGEGRKAWEEVVYFRALTADRQRGESAKGESMHYWVVIRDWWRRPDGKVQAQLVYEGRVWTDEDLDEKRSEYEIDPSFVLVDSGDEATKVYRMCAKYGYKAVKGEDREYYLHEVMDDEGERTGERVRKIFAPRQTQEAFFGDHEGGRPVEILLIRYSKQGIRDALDLIRGSEAFVYQVPKDVSLDYRRHWEAESIEERTSRKDGSTYTLWVQHAKRNDLFVCEAYQVLLASLLEFVGSAPNTGRPEDASTDQSTT